MSRPLPRPSPPSSSRPLPLPTNPLPYHHYLPLQYTHRPPSPTKRTLPPSPSGSTTPLTPPSSPRRPLPAAPFPSPRQQQRSYSYPDEDAILPSPPSPQYGIRDLPSRHTQHPTTSTSPAPNHPRPTARPPSITLRFATQALDLQPTAQSWPVNLDPLPHPPASPIRPTASPDLDNSPPHTSLPRKPFPHADTSTKRHPPPRWTSSSPSRIGQQQQDIIVSPAPLDGRVTRPAIPTIQLPGEDENGSGSDDTAPTITVLPHHDDRRPVPSIIRAPTISIFTSFDPPTAKDNDSKLPPPPVPMRRAGGLVCGSCGGSIMGRIVSAMGVRWHPGCFRCTVCQTLLEHVSSYERDGRPYCHLDYHEKFAPQCYSCKTAIIDERFITLDDPALGGKRTYHEQHFFCAECGDPFLAPPSSGGPGDRDDDADEVGFTIYRGHPYCEACHVRLHMPKCRKCKRSIRDEMQAVEALGSKWCWGCFVCEGCERPFEEPSFFQREGLPFCERCFSIILKNEL